MADHSDPVSNLEHDEISSLLTTLLHNTSQIQPFFDPARFPVAESSSCLNSVFESSGLVDRGRSSLPCSFPFGVEAVVGGDCRSEDEAEVRRGGPGRSSSKRSRAAEVHNLSEKRRRQKINEKMKALQKLIPNSNKTDKASMLDEAIEYLKQLQLQVQMLTMRNGSSLNPFYVPGLAQPLQLPSAVSLFEEGNSSTICTFPANPETSTQAILDLSTKTVHYDDKLHSARMPENTNSRITYVQEPSTNTHYRPFNATMLSKVLCKDSLLETNHCGQSSSSGISS